jgi:hypothetical protein
LWVGDYISPFASHQRPREVKKWGGTKWLMNIISENGEVKSIDDWKYEEQKYMMIIHP